MNRTEAFTTKLPPGLKRALDDACRRYGLRKNFVVEQALREKLEDLADAFDLEEARKTAVSFRPWQAVEKELRRRGKL
jgi:predicted transcriptional regulator